MIMALEILRSWSLPLENDVEDQLVKSLEDELKMNKWRFLVDATVGTGVEFLVGSLGTSVQDKATFTAVERGLTPNGR